MAMTALIGLSYILIKLQVNTIFNEIHSVKKDVNNLNSHFINHIERDKK